MNFAEWEKRWITLTEMMATSRHDDGDFGLVIYPGDAIFKEPRMITSLQRITLELHLQRLSPTGRRIQSLREYAWEKRPTWKEFLAAYIEAKHTGEK